MTKTITAGVAKIIHGEVHDALKRIAERHGLVLGKSGCRYEDSRILFSPEMKVLVHSTDGKSPQTAALLKYAKMHGIDPSVEFTFNGKVHRLVDYNPRAHRTPFITEAKPNQWEPAKRYRWSLDAVTDYTRNRRAA